MTWQLGREYSMKTFDPDNLPEGGWGYYQKHSITRAQRIEGPFTVHTREGVMVCSDGWLAIDSLGYPYPIAAEEFDRIYRKTPGDVV